MSPAILFVDDDSAVRRQVQSMLETYEDKWQVYFVDSASAALNFLETLTIDVVIADFQMPQTNGLELLAEIRRRDYWKSVPVVIVVDREDTQAKQTAVQKGATDILDKPIIQEDLIARVASMVRLKRTQDKLSAQTAILQATFEKQAEQFEQSQFEIVFRLSKAAEVHDIETGNHTLRVGFSSQLVALTMGLPKDFQTKIVLAAPLHDIGKLGVSDFILRKAGPLSHRERIQMQQHCVIGHRMLTESYRLPRCFEIDLSNSPVHSSPFIEMASIIALQHHEKWDGSGYPNGLIAENIDISARIVAIADVYDALRTKRSYKPSFSQDKSVEILRQDSGTHFDPMVVEAFLDCLPMINRINDELADPNLVEWKAA